MFKDDTKWYTNVCTTNNTSGTIYDDNGNPVTQWSPKDPSEWAVTPFTYPSEWVSPPVTYPWSATETYPQYDFEKNSFKYWTTNLEDFNTEAKDVLDQIKKTDKKNKKQKKYKQKDRFELLDFE